MAWYAQRGEDVMLSRLIGETKHNGLIIDVGAYDPIVDSVTAHFYLEKQFRCINIEPIPALFSLFPEARPRDINLRCGVSDREGFQVITEIVDTGLSTFHAINAIAAISRGHKANRIMCKLRTLSDICNEHVPLGQHIDALKIDVEGYEAEVIRGANWRLYRPQFVVVEATRPCTEIPNYDEWEPDLLAARYRFIHDDSLNRWYEAL